MFNIRIALFTKHFNSLLIYESVSLHTINISQYMRSGERIDPCIGRVSFVTKESYRDKNRNILLLIFFFFVNHTESYYYIEYNIHISVFDKWMDPIYQGKKWLEYLPNAYGVNSEARNCSMSWRTFWLNLRVLNYTTFICISCWSCIAFPGA